MDPRVEEKLDNFEGVVSSFEEKKARGEAISSEQIAILQTALFSIIAHHTIAGWWKDEMGARIQALTVHVGKFPQSEPNANSEQEASADIIAEFRWTDADEIETDYRTGIYYLIDEEVCAELNSKPFCFTVGKSDRTSLLVRVLSMSKSQTCFSWGDRFYQDGGLFGDSGHQNITCETAEFLKYYRLNQGPVVINY